jgi:8-oxo-dGTP pyrophosphatase MutT (NUDIX family)
VRGGEDWVHADAAGALAAFFAGRTPLAAERVVWPSGIELLCTSYLVDTPPPLDLVTSVRCVVFRGDAVLVVRDPFGVHVLPGGRRELGETLAATLRRELLEETGWSVAEPRLLACLRFRHLTPKPEHYPFPYPEFLQLVYVAEAVAHYPETLLHDPIEGTAAFVPLAEAGALSLRANERALLAAARRRRAGAGAPAADAGEQAP